MRTDQEMFKSCSLEKTWRIIRENLEGLTLDVGSGDGLIVAPHGNVVGLDIEKTESYVPLVLGDMHHLPFKNRTFDTITILQVLEHSDRPHLVLREMKRVIKENGKCIVVVPNAETPASRLATHVVGYNGHAYPPPTIRKHWRHKSFFGYEKLTSLIEKSGFKVSETYGNVPYFPIAERIFNKGLLRRIYCALGDLNKKWSKDLIFICRKRRVNPEARN